MDRAIHLINAVLVGTLAGLAIWAWGHLPEQIPAHLDAAGRPTRWTDRSFWGWFLLPMIALGTVALNYAVAALLHRFPQFVNVPNKAQFRALPPERREPVYAQIRQMLYALSIPLLLLFGLVQYSMWRAAFGDEPVWVLIAILAFSVLLGPVLLIVWTPRIQRAIDEASGRVD